MLARVQGRYFYLLYGLGDGVLWSEAISFHYGSEMHISVSHWFSFTRQGFVVIEDDTVTALPGVVSCERKSPDSINPIVFSPM